MKIDKTEYYQNLSAKAAMNESLKSAGLISNEEYFEEKKNITNKRLEFDKTSDCFDKTSDCCPRCKISMEIYDCFSPVYHYDESKLCCPKCGLIIKQYDDTYLLTSGGYISSPAKAVFSPNKHFANWLNQILGLTGPKDQKVIDTIKQYCLQNKINTISHESLRKILKALNLSKYYKYTSYFFINLTGFERPNISHELCKRANFLFRQYIQTREDIRREQPSFGPNNPPYSYLIYKIFDFLLPRDDTKNRIILHFIHLPSKATLNKRNEEWDIVWNKLNK